MSRDFIREISARTLGVSAPTVRRWGFSIPASC